MTERQRSIDPGPRGGRALNLFWLSVWLVLLIQPALTIPDQDPSWPAAVGLAGLVVLYLAVLSSVLCLLPGAAGTAAYHPRLAGLGLLTVLGVVLSVAYGAGQGWGLVMVCVAAAGICVLPTQRLATGWLAGTVVATGTITAYLGARHGVGFPFQEWFWMTLVIVLVGVSVLSGRRTYELIHHLHRTRAELAEAAVDAERLRFSRDLHDLLGHTLSLIVVKAEVARRSAGVDPDASAREAGEIGQIGRRALSEVREAVAGYRERPFAAELDSARTALAGAGVGVTVRTDGTPLPSPADGLFGWVVREATTNVVRHSRARHCEIDVRRAAGQATVEVRDDGVGAPPGMGRGLTGLAERVAAAGGRLEVGGREAGGWRVLATVPVTRAGP